jgi:hypothetical protein
MQQHVKILAILHIVFSGLILLAAVIMLALFGGLAGVVHMADEPDAMIGSAVLGIIGVVVVIVLLLIALPGLIAGIGLLSYQPWARILMIIICVVELPGVPFHTALGVYGLWVLLSNEGTALFRGPVPA